MNMFKIGRVNSISPINFLAHNFLFLKTKRTPYLHRKHVQAMKALWGCENGGFLSLSVYISKQPANTHFSQIFVIVVIISWIPIFIWKAVYIILNKLELSHEMLGHHEPKIHIIRQNLRHKGLHLTSSCQHDELFISSNEVHYCVKS